MTSYDKLTLAEVLDFITGSEAALLHADVTGGRPNRLVMVRLRQELPGLEVGSVPAFALADAPVGLRAHLAAELRRHGLSDLWLPTGYYLFHRGALIGTCNARPPETLRELQPALIVAGLAIVERLVTRRWGLMAKLTLPVLEVILGLPTADKLSAILREATSRAGAQGSTSSSRRSKGASARGGQRRQPNAEPPDPLWSSDPYEVLGISRSAADEEIKRAFRRMTTEHHPDKATSESDRFDREARQKQINLAYEAIRKERGR